MHCPKGTIIRAQREKKMPELYKPVWDSMKNNLPQW